MQKMCCLIDLCRKRGGKKGLRLQLLVIARALVDAGGVYDGVLVPVVHKRHFFSHVMVSLSSSRHFMEKQHVVVREEERREARGRRQKGQATRVLSCAKQKWIRHSVLKKTFTRK